MTDVMYCKFSCMCPFGSRRISSSFGAIPSSSSSCKQPSVGLQVPPAVSDHHLSGLITHQCSVLILLHIANTSDNCRSSEYFCRWCDLRLHWKSEVYKVNKNGYSTVPRGTRVLHIIKSDRSLPQSHILWPVCQVGSNPREDVHVKWYFLQLRPPQQRLEHVKCTWEIREGDPRSVALPN